MRLFLNGPVLTMDPARPVAEALAVRDERIVAVGSADQAALEVFWADCSTPPLGSIAEIQTALRRTAAKTPPGEWVRGWGYHRTHLAERRHPTRHDLDEAVPDRPRCPG